jgi:hypothetical protein
MLSRWQWLTTGLISNERAEANDGADRSVTLPTICNLDWRAAAKTKTASPGDETNANSAASGLLRTETNLRRRGAYATKARSPLCRGRWLRPRRWRRWS